MVVDKNIENLERCQCFKCLSYTNSCKLKNAPENFLKLMENYQQAKHYEKMYCAYEKSDCIYEKRGCLCHKCDISRQYKLKGKYFCLSGVVN